MPIDDPNVLLNDPDMSRDFLSDMLGTGEKQEKPPPDGKYLEGQPVVVDGLKGRPELNGRRGRALAGTWDAAKRRIGVELAPRGDEGSLRLSVKYENVRLPGAADAKAPRGPAVWEEEVAPAAELRTPLAQFEELRAALVELDPSGAIDDAAAAAAEPTSAASFAGTRPSTASIAAAPCNSHTEATAPALVHALRAAGDDAFDAIVRQQALDALANLCEGTLAGKHALLRAAAAPAIVEVMRARADAAPALAAAHRALANFANGDAACKEAVREAGGVAAVAAAMRAFPKEALLQQMGVGLLANMANAGGRCQKAVFDANGPAAVVRAMGAFRGDDRLQYFGCLALANLASERDAAAKEAVCDAGAAAAVAAALDRWGAPAAGGSAAAAGVRKWGVGALRNLASGPPECKQAIADEGGIGALARLMRGAREDAELQRMGCGVLAFVGQEAEAKRAAIDAGAVEAAVGAMAAHAADASVQEEGCLALVQFVFGDRDGRAAALDAGARAALEAARRSPEARRSPGEGHERLLGMCDALLKELDGGR